MSKVAKPKIRNLQKARTLIQNGWCKFVMAKNKDGGYANHLDDEAVKFCATGACMRVRGVDFMAPWELPEVAYLNKIVPKTYTNLASFNDAFGTNREQVLALFDKAISRLRKLNHRSSRG